MQQVSWTNCVPYDLAAILSKNMLQALLKGY
jgi:hypothetical protein